MIETIVNNAPKKDVINFPCLMISQDNAIILVSGFDDNKKTYYGTLLHIGDNQIQAPPIGTYGDDWIADSFRLFQGSVTLEEQA